MLKFLKRNKRETHSNLYGMELVKIEAGGFTMGCPRDEPERISGETEHFVTLMRPFFMGVHPVTQKQWKSVMGNNPSKFKKEENAPVEGVIWDQAVAFCEKLSQKDKKKYRLPTEAEWEYACRAGTTTPFNFGSKISYDLCNYDSKWGYNGSMKRKGIGRTTPVGNYPANPWGLFDMHGNVWEWCSDWFGPYRTDRNTDPTGALKGEERVMRGGSWMHTPRRARSACRGVSVPDAKEPFIGLRVAMDA